MSNSELLNELFKKYKLNYDKDNPGSKENDVFIHKHYKIITRAGIQKIEKSAGIWMDIDVVEAVSAPDNVTMRAEAYLPGKERPYITFASASAETSTNKYYAEMAEKRVRSRAVLTLAGLYELGVFGEDEAESFSKIIKDQKEAIPMSSGTSTMSPAVTTKATFKG